MRIVQLTDNLELGGLQRVVVELSNELVRLGHEVAVAAGPGRLWSEVGAHRYIRSELARPPWSRVLAAVSTIRELIAQLKPQIIDVHQRRLALLANLAAAGSGAVVVEHVHATFRDYRWLSFRSPVIVAVGSAAYGQLIGEYARDPRRVFHVPNGVRDPGRDVPLADSRGPLRLLGVGRVSEEKDPHYFGALTNALAGFGVEVEASWAGDGPLMEGVQTRWPHVRWLGEITPATACIAGHHALVITSRTEGLPLVALESLALGRPVLARDVGSCSDAVINGVTGATWPAQLTPDAAAELLIEELHLTQRGVARQTLSALGAGARDLFERKFDVEQMAAATEHVYCQISRWSPTYRAMQ